jgi:excisionase family DNA binding protein
MKMILAAAALLLAIIFAASSGVGDPGELHHVVLAAAAIPMAAKAELFTVAEACKILSVSKVTIYKLISIGQLDARKVLNGTRITAKSVEALLAAAPKAEITGKYLTLKTRRRLAHEREQGVSRA